MAFAGDQLGSKEPVQGSRCLAIDHLKLMTGYSPGLTLVYRLSAMKTDQL